MIQTFFSVQFYIRRNAILSSIRSYDYFVCRVNRFRVMIDFLRDSSAYPVLCKALRFSGLKEGGGERGGVFETFHISFTK